MQQMINSLVNRDRTFAEGPWANRLLLGLILGLGLLTILFNGGYMAMQGDSPSYINFSNIRTAGYPAILQLVLLFTDNPLNVKWLQIALLLGSLVLLSRELRSYFRSFLIPAAVVILILGNKEYGKYWVTLLTEPIFFPLSIAAAAMILRYLRRKALSDLVWVSLILGFMPILRPAAYPMFGAMILLYLAQFGALKGQRLKAAAALVLPYGVMIFLGAMGYAAKHDSFRPQSFLGHNLLGKVAFLPEDESYAPDYPGVMRVITETMAKPRAIEQTITDQRTRYLYRNDYYNIIKFRYTEPAFEALAAEEGRPIDDIRKAVALPYLKAYWPEFLYDTYLNYWAVWSLGDLQTAKVIHEFEAWVEKMEGISIAESIIDKRTPRSAAIVYGIKLYMGIGFVISVVVGLWFLGKLLRFGGVPGWLTFLGTLSILVHGNYLLIGALQAGIPRYTFSMWPYVTLILVIGIYMLLERFSGVGEDATTK